MKHESRRLFASLLVSLEVERLLNEKIQKNVFVSVVNYDDNSETKICITKDDRKRFFKLWEVSESLLKNVTKNFSDIIIKTLISERNHMLASLT